MTLGQMKAVKAFMRVFGTMNSWLYKKSGGKVANTFLGYDICVVSMKGAKTGKIRDIPLMYVPNGEDVLLVASLGGAPKHPTWYYNITANPECDVTVKGVTKRMRARRASTEEKAELWPVCVKYYPPYDEYQARTERDIPVFICEPIA